MVRSILDRKPMRAKSSEADAVDLPLARPPVPLGVQSLPGYNARAAWRIDIPGRNPVFMCIKDSYVESHVVHVDTDRFFRLWNESAKHWPHGERVDACERRELLPQDYKFDVAEKYMSNSERDKPIPLALVHIDETTGSGPVVGLSDGITRSKWLIANNAASFPVEVGSREQAQRLHELAGCSVGPISTVTLFGAQKLQADVELDEAEESPDRPRP